MALSPSLWNLSTNLKTISKAPSVVYAKAVGAKPKPLVVVTKMYAGKSLVDSTQIREVSDEKP